MNQISNTTQTSRLRYFNVLTLSVMVFRQCFSLLVALSFSFNLVHGQQMNNEGLFEILEENVEQLDGHSGAWSFVYEELMMLILTDEAHNRMRIISPIDEVGNLTQTQIIDALTANFHTALDVKYAIADDLMWSVFMHPLTELNKEQVEDAIRQVARAASTFGSSYSSTDLIFPGGGDGDEKNRSGVSPKKRM